MFLFFPRSPPGIQSRGSFVRNATSGWETYRRPSRIWRRPQGCATTTAPPSWSSACCTTASESTTSRSSQSERRSARSLPFWSMWHPPQTHCIHLSVPYSHVRECLKLDQDDKECFSHYKQVKKLSKQLDSAEELIQSERLVLLVVSYTCVTKGIKRTHYPIHLQSVTRKPSRSMSRWWRRNQMSRITPTWPKRGSASAWWRWVEGLTASELRWPHVTQWYKSLIYGPVKDWLAG